MGLLVALNSAPDYTARGSLFWDDGESFGLFIEEAVVNSFLPRDALRKRGLCCRPVSVRPSVCSSSSSSRLFI